MEDTPCAYKKGITVLFFIVFFASLVEALWRPIVTISNLVYCMKLELLCQNNVSVMSSGVWDDWIKTRILENSISYSVENP